MPFNETGYTKRTADELRELLEAKIQESVPAFEMQPAEVRSMLLDSSVVVMAQFEQICAEIINGVTPGCGADFIFSNLAASLGLIPKSASQASVTLTFSGASGTYIPEQTKVNSESGISFTTEDAAIIGTSGKVNVMAYADTDEVCAPNTITEIVTDLGDDITCTNESSSVANAEAESLDELKLRAQARLRSARKGGIDYATSLLKSIDGVDSRLINFVEKTISDSSSGITYQGVEAIVGGGDDAEIALALYRSFFETQKLISDPSTENTGGKTTYNLIQNNNVREIQFTRPLAKQLTLTLEIAFRSATISASAVNDLMTETMENYINNKQVGAQLNIGELNNILYGILEDNGVDICELQSSNWSALLDGETAEFNNTDYLEGLEEDIYLILAGFSVVSAG